MTSPENHTPEFPDSAEAQMSKMSRRSFLLGGIATATAAAGFNWLLNAENNNGASWPLRKILRLNETVAESYFDPSRMMPLLPVDRVTKPVRQNGDLGLSEALDASAWTLQVMPPKDAAGTADEYDEFTIDDIKKLPRHEMVTEFHCIEGWSMVQRWAGARLSDFVEQLTRYSDIKKVPKYIGIETPDGEYYVGLDRASALHPQTLLCYEMNGEPLPEEHGAPLRLIIPVKYGVKNLKRIGVIKFSDTRPADYWAEQGYDWYAGF